MIKAIPLLIVTVAICTLLAGCGSTSPIYSGANSQTVPVSISLTDDPPAGVSVLFFQVSLTAAALTPASGSSITSPVSLLANNTPIEVDVTKLQALSAFLSTANVPATTYQNLSLTFANPQLVIVNTSDTAIASTCAVGSICQLTPTVDNSATVTLSSAPFPVTVSANSPLGFLVDFHLNTIIQSDLSVNLGVANGISVAQLPPANGPQPPHFGFLTGAVGTVTASSNQFTLTTLWGRTFTVDTTSSTTFNDFPASACSAAGFSCVASGQIVQVQVASVASGGVLTASQVTYLQAAGQETVEGTIIAIPPLPLPSGETLLEVILHQNPTNNADLPLGGLASVAVWSSGTSNTATTFSIDANGFTLPTGLTFASTQDLTVGQTVQITITPGSLQPSAAPAFNGGWGPPLQLSFAASNLQLEPSQITGSVSDIASPDFTLNFSLWPQCGTSTSGIACPTWVALVQYNVETTSQTTYQGFTTDSFSGLADNDVVSVSGWLFPVQNGATLPTLVPQAIVQHPGGWY